MPKALSHHVMSPLLCPHPETAVLLSLDKKRMTFGTSPSCTYIHPAYFAWLLTSRAPAHPPACRAPTYACLLQRRNPQEHSPSNTLLVLDLGHIAFRRDETTARKVFDVEEKSARSSPGAPTAPAEALPAAAAPPSSDPESRVASAGGELAPGATVQIPPVAEGGGVEDVDVARNDWRLDVSGVQVRKTYDMRRGSVRPSARGSVCPCCGVRFGLAAGFGSALCLYLVPRNLHQQPRFLVCRRVFVHVDVA